MRAQAEPSGGEHSSPALLGAPAHLLGAKEKGRDGAASTARQGLRLSPVRPPRLPAEVTPLGLGPSLGQALMQGELVLLQHSLGLGMGLSSHGMAAACLLSSHGCVSSGCC